MSRAAEGETLGFSEIDTDPGKIVVVIQPDADNEDTVFYDLGVVPNRGKPTLLNTD